MLTPKNIEIGQRLSAYPDGRHSFTVQHVMRGRSVTELECVVTALQDGKSVGLPGLGTLSVKKTAARTGVRPGTSEKVKIPAGKKVAFKVASTLKGNL